MYLPVPTVVLIAMLAAALVTWAACAAASASMHRADRRLLADERAHSADVDRRNLKLVGILGHCAGVLGAVGSAPPDVVREVVASVARDAEREALAAMYGWDLSDELAATMTE